MSEKLIENGYGVMVKPVCDQCGHAVQVLNGKVNDYTPCLCAKCGKSLCGHCSIEGYDGNETVLCKLCGGRPKSR